MKVPILAFVCSPVSEGDAVSRSQLKDVAEQRLFARQVIEGQKPVDHRWVQVGCDRGVCKNSLDLGSENDRLVGLGVVQRLDSDPVACEKQGLLAVVPNRKRKHSSQPLDAGLPQLLIQMDDNFGVC